MATPVKETPVRETPIKEAPTLTNLRRNSAGIPRSPPRVAAAGSSKQIGGNSRRHSIAPVNRTSLVRSPRRQSIGIPGSPRRGAAAGGPSRPRGNFRRYSFGVPSSQKSIGDEGTALPHYLRASIGSCHDFCKYGKSNVEMTTKSSPIITPRKKAAVVCKDKTLRRVDPFERKKTTTVPKLKPLPVPKISATAEISNSEISLPSKRVGVSKGNSSISRKVVENKLKTTCKSSASYVKPKPVSASSTPDVSGGSNGGRKNSSTKTAEKTGIKPKAAAVERVVAKTIPSHSLSPKPSINRVVSSKARNLKLVSHLRDQNRMPKTELKELIPNTVQEKTLYIVKADPEIPDETLELESVSAAAEVGSYLPSLYVGSSNHPMSESSQSSPGKEVIDDSTFPDSESSQSSSHKEILEDALDKEVLEEASDKEVLDEASNTEILEVVPDKEVLDEAYDKEGVEEASNKELLEEAPDKEVLEEAYDEEVLEMASIQEVVEEASDKEALEEGYGKEVLEEASNKEVLEEASDKEFLEDVSNKEILEAASDKEVLEEGYGKEVLEEASNKEVLEEASDKEFLEQISNKEILEASDKEVLEEGYGKEVLEEASEITCSEKDQSSSDKEVSEDESEYSDYEEVEEEGSEYSDNDGDVPVSENDNQMEVSNGIQNNIPRKGRVASTDDKGDIPVKLKFRRGRVLDLQSENNGPRRLKFRRARVLEGTEAAQSSGKRSFRKRVAGEEANAADHGSNTVVLKHQDLQGKKDSQGLFNNVIEETASKLAESRKSKVKALVGAFETVISLQDGKPST